MADLIDYIKWRGDLDFTDSPFNGVDALVLCQISYLGFDGIIPEDVKNTVTMAELWDDFRLSSDFSQRADVGLVINKATVNIFECAAKSVRFSNIRFGGYINKIDTDREEQFCALTVFLEKAGKNPIVYFRGTDDTIVGWKEDFNMALSDSVPAQLDAIDYVTKVAAKTSGKISFAGHSKGGNLAVYSGCFIPEKYQRRVDTIYNFDGPGFTSKVTQKKEYKRVIPKMKSWYPHLSIVGMLFEHAGTYTVVESEASGIMQHDPLSWRVEGNDFIKKTDFDEKSVVFNKTFNAWISSLPKEKLEVFIETLFDVLEASGARTNSELESNWLESSIKMIKALKKVDKETKDAVSDIVRLLFESAKQNRPEFKLLKL